MRISSDAHASGIGSLLLPDKIVIGICYKKAQVSDEARDLLALGEKLLLARQVIVKDTGMDEKGQSREGAATLFQEITSRLGGFFHLWDKTDRAGTIETITENIEFRGASLWSLIVAIVLASIGLNANSAALIIARCSYPRSWDRSWARASPWASTILPCSSARS